MGKRAKKISKKISKLVGEGYPQKQAVAIAYSMNRKRGKGGSKKRGKK